MIFRGQVLRERSVDMVQLVDRIEWSPTRVEVRLLADWVLPFGQQTVVDDCEAHGEQLTMRAEH